MTSAELIKRAEFMKRAEFINIDLANTHDYLVELRRDDQLASVPLLSDDAGADVAELIHEAYVRGVLAESLPTDCHDLRVELEPMFSQPPVVRELVVRITARPGGIVYETRFVTGRWARTCQAEVLRLHEQALLPKDQAAHVMLLAIKRRQPRPLDLPRLAPPTVHAQSLESLGVRDLTPAALDCERPVLLNRRLVKDAVRRCEQADTQETGAAVLGKLVRLAAPLPGTTTRIVTVLSTMVEDPRHVGAPLSFFFSPEGLAEAAQFGDLRGFGETVQTVFHTHGWSKSCGNCNQNPGCPLAECKPSLQDYRMLESLLSSKTTLLPIAGRKLGATGRRPVLQLYAWSGGTLRPIRWQEYHAGNPGSGDRS